MARPTTERASEAASSDSDGWESVEAQRPDTRRVYTGRTINLSVRTIALPSGAVVEREIVEHRGAVVIAALDEHDQIVLVRQERIAVGHTLLELPAGTLERGEAADVCAVRELAEETGLAAARWRSLARFYSSPGFCTELMYLYLAEGLSPATANPDEDEEIAVERLPLAEACLLIRTGEIRDAKSIAGILLARDVRTAAG